jgi:hypothetical protein
MRNRTTNGGELATKRHKKHKNEGRTTSPFFL